MPPTAAAAAAATSLARHKKPKTGPDLIIGFHLAWDLGETHVVDGVLKRKILWQDDRYPDPDWCNEDKITRIHSNERRQQRVAPATNFYKPEGAVRPAHETRENHDTHDQVLPTRTRRRRQTITIHDDDDNNNDNNGAADNNDNDENHDRTNNYKSKRIRRTTMRYQPESFPTQPIPANDENYKPDDDIQEEEKEMDATSEDSYKHVEEDHDDDTVEMEECSAPVEDEPSLDHHHHHESPNKRLSPPSLPPLSPHSPLGTQPRQSSRPLTPTRTTTTVISPLPPPTTTTTTTTKVKIKTRKMARKTVISHPDVMAARHEASTRHHIAHQIPVVTLDASTTMRVESPVRRYDRQEIRNILQMGLLEPSE